MQVIWKPYQRMFRHRSRWTHGILVGPLVRILYLAACLAVVAAGFGAIAVALGLAVSRWEQVLEEVWRRGQEIERIWLIYGLAGIWGGAALHTLADEVVSKAKRLLRFGKPRR
ncbi:hypothetical protein D3C87_1890580 [compost metagenome]